MLLLQVNFVIRENKIKIDRGITYRYNIHIREIAFMFDLRFSSNPMLKRNRTKRKACDDDLMMQSISILFLIN